MQRSVGVVLAFGAVLLLSGCAGRTTDASDITDGSAILHATGRCDKGETCTWYWEYWSANQPRSTSTKTQVFGPVNGPAGSRRLSAQITGLQPDTAYRLVFCASPNGGGVYGCAGPHGTFGSTTADPPPDYATLTTAPAGTLAEAWDGTNWTIQPTPNPSAAASSLSGVSCTSRTACTAVGRYINSAGTKMTLAARRDGTTWTVQPTPNPTGAIISALTGVSCTSARACIAVGTYFDHAGTAVTLAEAWDGTTWTIQPTPNPSAAASSLSGVSCTSATACTAVGQDFNAQTRALVPLVERWDGTTWTIQPTSNPTGGGILAGVSCTSATACTAVGFYSNNVSAPSVWRLLIE